MKSNQMSNANPMRCPHHSGVTLTEVLMSLMIMSIGISSVAVLFPISALRSIQANQLTHGALVKYSVETILKTDPAWIFDPDRDGDLNEHFRTAAQRNYVVDPSGFYTHYLDGNGAAAGFFGNDGTNPVAALGRFGGGLTTLDGVSDPTTSAAHASALRLRALALSNEGDGWRTDVDVMPLSLIGSPNGVVGIQLPPPSELDLTQVATSDLLLPPGSGPLEYLIPDPELYRIVLFSLDGKFSQAFPLTYIDTTTNAVSWSEDIDADGTGDRDYNMSGFKDGIEDIRPLPNEFFDTTLGSFQVSRVLIQSRKVNDFSWLLTVRRRSDGFVRNVDVVVKFNDGADLNDERLYLATFVNNTNVVGIRFPYRLNPADTLTPSLKKGKFVLDAQNARWYRIQDYQERPLGNIGWAYPEYDAVVFTETEIQDPAGEDQYTTDGSGASLLLNGVLDTVSGLSEDEVLPGDNDGTLDFGYAMFPKSVVDVYPTGSIKMP